MTSIATARAPTFVEFFAGGGMARAGLEGWTCLLANDMILPHQCFRFGGGFGQAAHARVPTPADPAG